MNYTQSQRVIILLAKGSWDWKKIRGQCGSDIANGMDNAVSTK